MRLDCTQLNLVKDSIETFKILVGRCRNLLVLHLSNRSLIENPLMRPATCQSGVVCFFVPSLPDFWVWASVSDHTWEVPKEVCEPSTHFS